MDINRHFLREGKVMILVALLPLIIGLLAAFIVPRLVVHTAIDSCLDAGGSYDYDNCRCDHKETHAFKADHDCD